MQTGEIEMYVITGITGKVGGVMARCLRAEGKPVRAVLRNLDKAVEWQNLGCDIAVADIGDEAALTTAFAGAEAVFILPPPNFDPLSGFPEARAEAETIRAALEKAMPGRVLCLSTVGAQASQTNLLTQRTILEQVLGDMAIPLTFLRPAWFLDNFAWDVASARDEGVIRSFLQPLDRQFPMVFSDWIGRRIVEMEGPQRVSAHEAAALFSEVLQRPVRAESVPRESWSALFVAQGMRNPTPRIQMLDGFNEGWLTFEGDDRSLLKGRITPRAAIEKLLQA
jgi:uncharacterized protein YbjT (DUF2867 family)